MQYMIFQYGWEAVLIQRILISFEHLNNNNGQSDNPRTRVAVRVRNNELELYIKRVAKWEKIIQFWGGIKKHKQTDLFKLYSI